MNAIRQNVVPASPETAQWGYFDALRKPVLVINTGDQVRINTVSGVPAVTPEERAERCKAKGNEAMKNGKQGTN